MFPERDYLPISSQLTRMEGFSCVAEQVEHLTISKLHEAKLYITALVGLFVFLVKVSKSNDEKKTGICRQTDRCFDSADRIEGGEKKQLINIVFYVIYQRFSQSFEQF